MFMRNILRASENQSIFFLAHKNMLLEILNLSSHSGLLAPVWAAAVLVTDSLNDLEDRFYGCMVIHICQTIITVCYIFTFFFSLLFRMVLIRFSDRGLIVKGKYNLFLFHQLYWIVFGAFFFMAVSIFIIVPLIRGTFAEIPHSKMCMLRPTENMKTDSSPECDECSFFFTNYKYPILFCFQKSPNT